MKKILSLLLITSVLGYMACSEDDEPTKNGAKPTVTLLPTTAQDIPGATVSTTISIDAPNGGETLQFSGNVSNADMTLNGEKEQEVEVDFEIPAGAAINSVISAVITVVDKKGLTSSPVEFTITVGDPVETLEGSINANKTLDAGTQYMIVNQVFVESGVTLTIPAGTVIMGNKATKGTLIVKPGGMLVANGTSTNPVVFTSNQPVGARDRGDWGGIVMLGGAFVNQTSLPAIEGITPAVTYGNNTSPATNATQNSGTLTYVRIEYAGIELTPNNETNSLTMGGIGNGTTIDYVQASFGGDDSFEWFGGTVNAKHLVSLSTWDDDFDTDFGYSGNVQFGLIVRNPFFADQSGSNAFESDNQGNANITFADDATRGCHIESGITVGCTRAVFSNITVLGPRETNARAISASYQNAMHIRRRSAISIFNSFFSGFRTGLRVDDAPTLAVLNDATAAGSRLSNNVLSVPGTSLAATTSTQADAAYITGITADASSIATLWTASNTTFNNVTATTVLGDVGITPANYWAAQSNVTYPSNPNFALTAGVAGANNLNDGESFADSRVSGTFFTATTYRGAFGATDWTDGWAEFQPQTTVH